MSGPALRDGMMGNRAVTGTAGKVIGEPVSSRHATHTEPQRLKLPREADTGHILRGVGYVTTCTCGWVSPRCKTFGLAMEHGRAHVREHASHPARETVD